ncbi:CotY/CotZ family spore coat protein [Haloplasma contractile]|nr:CotY/CotZ family spore coat protein [Haloplasma contractile]
MSYYDDDQIKMKPKHECKKGTFNCVCDEVRFIEQLQKEAVLEENCLNCSTEKLGANRRSRIGFNTRPFILYLPNGREFRIRVSEDFECDYRSAIFRVEDVDGCCATLRALVEKDNCLFGTQFCVTVDLTQFVAIQCFRDIRIASPCSNV